MVLYEKYWLVTALGKWRVAGLVIIVNDLVMLITNLVLYYLVYVSLILWVRWSLYSKTHLFNWSGTSLRRCQGNAMNLLCYDYHLEGLMSTADMFTNVLHTVPWLSPVVFLYPTQLGSLCNLTKELRSQHLWRWWRLKPLDWQKTLPTSKLLPRWRSPPWTARGRWPGLTSWSTATWTSWLPRVSEPLVSPFSPRCCLML